jgi:predicted phosphoadenosine phosphosulfate sulfurtransferase
LFSGRAPSWKAIAICLLNNDFRLHKLGYTTTPGEWAQAAIDLAVTKSREPEQPSLFDPVT